MLSSGDSLLRTPDPKPSVFGPVQFVGRGGLVKNLAGRCSRRQSVLVYGGPKLGKTSLLLQLRWVLQQQQTSSGSRPTVQYLDLCDDEIRQRLHKSEWDRAQVLLLDNCESLLDEDGLLRTLKGLVETTAQSQAIVWAGGRTWYEWARSSRSELKLHPAPLAVLLNGEARSLLATVSRHADAALEYGGTHPYVLTVLKTYLQGAGPEAASETVIHTVREHLAPLFARCFMALREPAEQQLLNWLVRKGKQANPREAAEALDMASVKQAADTLCYLGLISRWNLNEGAMLHANCRLFNEWYRARTDQPE